MWRDDANADMFLQFEKAFEIFPGVIITPDTNADDSDDDVFDENFSAPTDMQKHAIKYRRYKLTVSCTAYYWRTRNLIRNLRIHEFLVENTKVECCQGCLLNFSISHRTRAVCLLKVNQNKLAL
jgi:hypothetical protein